MTHAFLLLRRPPVGNRRSVEDLPELDEVLRQLSSLLELPLDCRRIACRRSARCQGGEGPPCFYRKREFIAKCIQSGLRDTRRFWKRQRALARAAEAVDLRRP
jgi:hypothetical protein